jgi:hypothetical protein
MAFVAGRSLVLGAGAIVLLPAAVDVGGNAPGFTLYSHMRVPGGTTYTFDNGVVQVVPATTDSVIAIPPGATSIVATAASTVQLGQSR